MAIIALLGILVGGMAYADNAPAEQDYRDLDELHLKLMRMRREMDRFMRDIVSAYPSSENLVAADFGQDVKVDMSENDKEIIVRADLPGMDKDKIEVTLENGKILKIAGTRDISKQEKSPGVIRQERMHGRFERAVELPSEGRGEGIKASYKNGVLEIVIPKLKEEKEKAVKINVQ